MENIEETNKESVQAWLVEVIEEYLEKLQSGRFGTPTLKDLQNAGLLHQFVEKTKFS